MYRDATVERIKAEHAAEVAVMGYTNRSPLTD
jgi:hypothetical protein